MSKVVKIFNLDSMGNVSLGSKVELNQGKYYKYTSIGQVDPIRIDVSEQNDLVWLAYLVEFSFPGETDWEHQMLLIPLPGTMSVVEKMEVERAVLVTPTETIIIRKGDVKFLSDSDTAVFFQNGINLTFH